MKQSTKIRAIAITGSAVALCAMIGGGVAFAAEQNSAPTQPTAVVTTPAAAHHTNSHPASDQSTAQGQQQLQDQVTSVSQHLIAGNVAL